MIQPPAMPPGAAPAAPLAPMAPQVPPLLHDCVVQRSKTKAQAKVMPVPPEEWGVGRNTRSLAECNYCFHRPAMTEGKAIAQGYDKEQIKALPTYNAFSNSVEETSRDTVNEHQFAAEGANTAARSIDLVEHYIRMDYEGKGELKLYKVTTGGPQGEILRKTDTDPETGKNTKKEDIEEFDMIPFAAMTPVIMTHRFFGRSIADLIMDIQRIKTAVTRGLLDNTYLANNPRVEVAEDGCTGDTLDDLLVARPGGLVRTKRIGSIQWQEVPDRTGSCLPVLEYLDTVREWRTGVTRQGQGIGADALQNQSATAVSQVFSMAQARIKLVARIFAETGIKDLFVLLHGLIRKHGQEAQTVRLRKQWVSVDPRDWKNRNDLTVHVGLGDGSKAEQMGRVGVIGNMQKELLLGGKSNIVTDKNLYEMAKQGVKISGLKNVGDFFTDPATVPPPQAPADPAMLKIQAQMQLETAKAQKEMEVEQAKTQSQILIEREKHQAAMELAAFNAKIKAEQHQMDIAAREQQAHHARQSHEMEMAKQIATHQLTAHQSQQKHAHDMASTGAHS